MRTSTHLFLPVMVVLLSSTSTLAQEALWEKLNSKVVMLYQRGELSEAVKIAEQALKVAEKTFGPNHRKVAASLNNLAELYAAQGKYAEAESLYKRSLAIWEKALGPNHPYMAQIYENMAKGYRTLGKDKEAEQLEARAKKIRSTQ
jgi:tetratricopeptide (TPR) repeat protein